MNSFGADGEKILFFSSSMDSTTIEESRSSAIISSSKSFCFIKYLLSPTLSFLQISSGSVIYPRLVPSAMDLAKSFTHTSSFSMEHSESIPRAWRREMISFSISLSESKEEEMDSDSCFPPIFVTYMLKLSLSGFELNSLIISMTSSFSFLLAFLLIELSPVVIK